MKKILPAFFLLTFLVFPALALAAPEIPDEPIEPIFESGADLLDMLDTIADWAFAILMGLAAIVLIIGGIQFITAQGSSEKVSSARQWLIWALVGVAVGVAAKGLVAVVRSILGG